MELDQNIYNLVVESYNTAVNENGYDLDSLSIQDVADDMFDCIGDLEGADYSQVCLAIRTYRDRRL